MDRGDGGGRMADRLAASGWGGWVPWYTDSSLVVSQNRILGEMCQKSNFFDRGILPNSASASGYTEKAALKC